MFCNLILDGVTVNARIRHLGAGKYRIVEDRHDGNYIIRSMTHLIFSIASLHKNYLRLIPIRFLDTFTLILLWVIKKMKKIMSQQN